MEVLSIRSLIVCALAREFQAALKCVQDVRVASISPFRSATGRFGDDAAAVVQTGIGPSRAHQATEWAINCFEPERVIAVGFAGALLPSLKVGTLVVANQVLDASERENIHLAGDPLRIATHLPERTPNGHCVCGLIASLGRPAASPLEKQALFQRTGAIAVDTESFGIAKACAAHHVPLAVARAISDDAAMSIPPEILGVVRPDGSLAPWRIAWALLRRPILIRDLRVLRTASRKAEQSLRRALQSMKGEAGDTDKR
jgi:adenosylhomocysteine nucleosidase